MKKLLIGLLLFSSCSKNTSPTATLEEKEKEVATVTDGYSTKPSYNNTGASNSVENDDTIMQLEDHLRGLAGVNVRGFGSTAQVTVRGINSFQASSQEPLFVINGTAMASYSAAYLAINPREIKRVTVLTDAASTGVYGMRGANGVIIITLKAK